MVYPIKLILVPFTRVPWDDPRSTQPESPIWDGKFRGICYHPKVGDLMGNSPEIPWEILGSIFYHLDSPITMKNWI